MSGEGRARGTRGNGRPRIADAFLRFFELENAGAILLLAMTILALLWANSPWSESYFHLWHTPIALSIGGSPFLDLSLEEWVSDALMAVFFFSVGLEIKKELVLGELSSLDRAMLPFVAALGGMIVPASIYALLHHGGPAAHGWGIPMATDIAFAVAALAILGKRVPAPLKVFLLALAIVDDLGAVVVIAVFYTPGVSLGSLLAAAALLAVVYGLNRAGVRSFFTFAVLGLGVWYFVFQSGVHATIAGVLLGFTVPATADRPREALIDRARELAEGMLERIKLGAEGHSIHPEGQRIYDGIRQLYRDVQSPLDYLNHVIERWVVFVIMPVFALANAGVRFDATVLGDPLGDLVALGVGLGLVIGKPIGITLFSAISVRLGFATLPRHVSYPTLFGTGLLAGIGFTMSLFVTGLAFDNGVFTSGAKIGIIVGSVTATLAGVLVLRRTLPQAAEVQRG